MAFISDQKGNYPLHIAINNHQSCQVIYELFKAFPAIGAIVDINTGLLPFMLAAVNNWESISDQITITYQLLREDPHSVDAM